MPNRRFVGCLKSVYYNSQNILYDLNRGNSQAKYHSLFPLELGCKTIDAVPLTFQSKSYIKLPINKTALLSFNFDFRPATTLNYALLNGTFMTASHEIRKWTLFVQNEDTKLHIEPEERMSRQIIWTLSNDNSLKALKWNNINIVALPNGFFTMSVNNITVKGRYDIPVERFNDDVFMGSIRVYEPLVACVKNIFIQRQLLDVRKLFETKSTFGPVSLDNCQLLDPCARPDVCEHGSICVSNLENATYHCDCSNTGYIGRTCHFCKLFFANHIFLI